MSFGASRKFPRDSRRKTRPRSWSKRWKDIRNRIMTLASELDLPKMLTRERHRVHLIGVAGSGMSGIAALLLELGHDVSGSDKVKSWEVDRLQRLGLRFRAEHRAEDAKEAELVIYSSAIRETNPILAAAIVAH